ncbi:hypothetical protein [Mesorhizobium sp. B2-5-3]|uniref:hypothetical protein n=1 Tax=Mesorhizobium sp. B2-5-3 TaxID=2589927 RepID=UPI00112DAF09|nr:hypothetical protein [Mesorhizobium sp. B2-5-3]TPK38701.1 hypothetical protein FJ867_08840 [Mesorhizobium sp. B2-5-3]
MAKLSSVLEAATAHYGGQQRKDIKVKEWGTPGKPLVITWSPWTVAERNKVYRRDDNGVTPDGGIIQVRALIAKACDEAGKRLFDEMDEHVLTHKVDSDVVGRIAAAILYGSMPGGSAVGNVVEAEKTAEGGPRAHADPRARAPPRQDLRRDRRHGVCRVHRLVRILRAPERRSGVDGERPGIPDPWQGCVEAGL